jgi:hypothetical protein
MATNVAPTQELLTNSVVLETDGAEAESINKTIFTPDEQRILNFTKAKRLQSVEALYKNGSPEKTNELRIANELMTSLDKAINDQATNRLKYQETQSKGEVANKLAGLARAIAESRAKRRPIGILETDANYVPDDIVEGEMDINPDMLDPNEYLSPNEE